VPHRPPAVVVPHGSNEAGDPAALVGLHLSDEGREVNRSIAQEGHHQPPASGGRIAISSPDDT
jgi:hypothetical protein